MAGFRTGQRRVIQLADAALGSSKPPAVFSVKSSSTNPLRPTKIPGSPPDPARQQIVSPAARPSFPRLGPEIHQKKRSRERERERYDFFFFLISCFRSPPGSQRRPDSQPRGHPHSRGRAHQFGSQTSALQQIVLQYPFSETPHARALWMLLTAERRDTYDPDNEENNFHLSRTHAFPTPS